MLNRLRRAIGAVRRDNQMSDRWLRAQACEMSRVQFDGPRIQLPIPKIDNEVGWLNRLRLRRPA